jgi:hypothetical protein
MKYLKLRIARSVVFGVASVLLIAMWLRSYRAHDMLKLPTERHLLLTSSSGVFGITLRSAKYPMNWPPGWGWKTLSGDNFPGNNRTRRWFFNSSVVDTQIEFPIWLPVMASIALAIIPNLRHRPSRRPQQLRVYRQ